MQNYPYSLSGKQLREAHAKEAEAKKELETLKEGIQPARGLICGTVKRLAKATDVLFKTGAKANESVEDEDEDDDSFASDLGTSIIEDSMTEEIEKENKVPLDESNELFKKVKISLSARSDILSRLALLKAVVDVDTNDKKKAGLKSAFIRSILRAMFSKNDFLSQTFTGRQSAMASQAKIAVVEKYIASAGISVDRVEIQRAYERCRETELLKKKLKAK
ncbi:MAG: hypothetical protein AAGK05_08830 [Pseudomonadota bacterium]